jgi:eukaryotic-like serine/threonine-protein kinase
VYGCWTRAPRADCLLGGAPSEPVSNPGEANGRGAARCCVPKLDPLTNPPVASQKPSLLCYTAPMATAANPQAPSIVGRYRLHAQIASGGMATVHVGRLLGPVGFSRTVAIKRLHGGYCRNPEFVAMFLDEARLAARIRHPNVVSIIDVVAEEGELLLVMDYVQGESLSKLLRAEQERRERVDPRVAVKIMTDVLSGLHAAHEIRNERGEPLGVVHRDVSPQNILVGADGVAQLIDFGVAKAAGRVQSTKNGALKGKPSYMSPEQIRGEKLDRRTDIYAAGTVLWEVLVGRRLFTGRDADIIHNVISGKVWAPTAIVPDLPAQLDAIVMKALQGDARRRFSTALEMADFLESALAPATSRDVARWMERLAGDVLTQRARLVRDVESGAGNDPVAQVAAQLQAQAPPAIASTPPPAEMREPFASDAALTIPGRSPASPSGWPLALPAPQSDPDAGEDPGALRPDDWPIPAGPVVSTHARPLGHPAAPLPPAETFTEASATVSTAMLTASWRARRWRTIAIIGALASAIIVLLIVIGKATSQSTGQEAASVDAAVSELGAVAEPEAIPDEDKTKPTEVPSIASAPPVASGATTGDHAAVSSSAKRWSAPGPADTAKHDDRKKRYGW